MNFCHEGTAEAVDGRAVGVGGVMCPPGDGGTTEADGGRRTGFESILWILLTGAEWQFLPEQFPSPSTCWRRQVGRWMVNHHLFPACHASLERSYSR